MRSIVAGLGLNAAYVSLGLAVGVATLVAATTYDPDGLPGAAFVILLSFYLTLGLSALTAAVVFTVALPLVVLVSHHLRQFSVTANAWICFAAGLTVAGLLLAANGLISLLITDSLLVHTGVPLGSPWAILASLGAAVIAGTSSAMAYLTVALAKGRRTR